MGSVLAMVGCDSSKQAAKHELARKKAYRQIRMADREGRHATHKGSETTGGTS